MIVVGLKNIGALFGKSSRTAYRWITQHGFIARQMPNGHWFTSLTFVDQWIQDGHANNPLVKGTKPIRVRRKGKAARRPPKDNEPVVQSDAAD